MVKIKFLTADNETESFNAYLQKKDSILYLCQVTVYSDSKYLHLQANGFGKHTKLDITFIKSLNL